MFSSPSALLAALTNDPTQTGNALQGSPPLESGSHLLERLLWRADRWREETDAALQELPRTTLTGNASHRLAQVLRAAAAGLHQPDNKILIFTSWAPTYDILYERLRNTYGKSAVARFRRGLDPDTLQAEVDRFQSERDCRIMLTDELGGEGRNFQMASQIIHVDLPWTPAQVEQRIGRVDRLGRQGIVLSIVPVARGTLEEDLFSIWHEAFHLFEQSMSGLEIVLEEVQDEIIRAFAQNTSRGLADLLPQMKLKAEQLRADVEEERYFEEGAINYRRRAEFAEISEQYRDGERMRGSLLGWADMAGLNHLYDTHGKLVTFDPHTFSLKSIENAKFARLPNMQEALVRSGRTHNLVLRGTFDRDRAIVREDIIFFAPGEPWTDAILTNALQADRGKCTGIMRSVPGLHEDWLGLELLYHLQVDPRPLYAQGFHPAHLFRAGGYLQVPTHHLFVSAKGEIVIPSSTLGQILSKPFRDGLDQRLGKRGGTASLLRWFVQMYPQPGWGKIVEGMINAAEQHLADEMSFTQELAEEAEADFDRSAAGQRAAYRWLQGSDDAIWAAEITEFEAVSRAW